jgi:hypothetical protein
MVIKMKKKWMTFKEARRFVHTLNLKSVTAWLIYCKSGKRPDNLPSVPRRTYKKEWKGMGDWLGTEITQTQKRVYKNFNDARKFVHKLKLKNRNDWIMYCKSEIKPNNLPNNPWHQYKSKGWITMGDWLGTGRVATFNIQYMEFSKAMEFVHTLELKSRSKWQDYCKSGNKPDNIPYAPWLTYKNKGWTSMGNFLGTGRVASQKYQSQSYEKAREFVQKLGLKNASEWRKYCNLGNKPDDIPSNPDKTYKNKGWISYGDFLGTRNISMMLKSKDFLPFKDARTEARKIAKKYGIKTRDDWIRRYREGKIPQHLPSDPYQHYGRKK